MNQTKIHHMNKHIAASAIILLLLVVGCSESASQREQASATSAPGADSVQLTQPNVENRRLPPGDVNQVAPALERYTQEQLYGQVWTRSGLSKRDRSIVTVAALIARSQNGGLH
jgi:alkylhydroperoxidase/carboxymuconolactone decarboxylase family protein YurZ